MIKNLQTTFLEHLTTVIVVIVLTFVDLQVQTLTGSNKFGLDKKFDSAAIDCWDPIKEYF